MKRNRQLSARDRPIRIGVSACLLGAAVRFDGGHKRSRFLVDTLSGLVEFVPVCPEVEIGLGVPRETMRLVRRHGETRLIADQTGIDHTDRMIAYAERRVAALGREDLCGYVLKNNSPSCGMERVRVWRSSGTLARTGSGLFAAALMRRYPSLPVEEEERLADPGLRDNFIERIFAYRRLRSFFSSRWTLSGLARFHAAHRLVLMAHSPLALRDLDRLVANGKRTRGCADRYEIEFMRALEKPATTGRHAAVMRHMLRDLRPHLERGARAELAAAVASYRRGRMPLAAALARFRRCVRGFGPKELRMQLYFEPDPAELALRTRAAREFAAV